MTVDGYIFFKFASDPARERIPCTGAEMLITDLKFAISEKKTLPIWDLVISNEDTGKVYSRPSDIVPRNSSVLVCRTPMLSKKKTAVISSSALRSDTIVRLEPEKPKTKSLEVIHGRPFPPEYLCLLCSKPFENPLIRTCCGKSACEACLETAIALDSGVCPLCTSEESASQVPNICLRESVCKLDRRFYFLPGEDCAPVTTFFDPPPSSNSMDVVKDEQALKAEDGDILPPIERPPSTVVINAVSSTCVPAREVKERVKDIVIDIDTVKSEAKDEIICIEEDVKSEGSRVEPAVKLKDERQVKDEDAPKMEPKDELIDLPPSKQEDIGETDSSDVILLIDVERDAACEPQLREWQKQAWQAYWKMQASATNKRTRIGRKESPSKRAVVDVIEINEDADDS